MQPLLQQCVGPWSCEHRLSEKGFEHALWVVSLALCAYLGPAAVRRRLCTLVGRHVTDHHRQGVPCKQVVGAPCGFLGSVDEWKL